MSSNAVGFLFYQCVHVMTGLEFRWVKGLENLWVKSSPDFENKKSQRNQTFDMCHFTFKLSPAQNQIIYTVDK